MTPFRERKSQNNSIGIGKQRTAYFFTKSWYGQFRMEGGILKYKNNFCKSFLFRWKLWAIQNYDIKNAISLSAFFLLDQTDWCFQLSWQKNPVDHCRSCVRNLKGLRYFFQRSIYWRKKTLRLQGIGTYANVDVIMWNSRWLQRKMA